MELQKLQEIKDCVESELQSHCGKNASTAPVNHKTVRTVYIEGQIPLSTIYQFQQLVFVTRQLTSQQEKSSLLF